VRKAQPPRGRALTQRSARSSARTAARTNRDLLEADFDDPDELTPQKLVRTHRAIGRELRRLDAAIGRENTADLWSAYRALDIAHANSSEAALTETAGALQQIQEAIVDRGTR
jgi:hypothetical protein